MPVRSKSSGTGRLFQYRTEHPSFLRPAGMARAEKNRAVNGGKRDKLSLRGSLAGQARRLRGYLLGRKRGPIRSHAGIPIPKLEPCRQKARTLRPKYPLPMRQRALIFRAAIEPSSASSTSRSAPSTSRCWEKLAALADYFAWIQRNTPTRYWFQAPMAWAPSSRSPSSLEPITPWAPIW